MRPDHGAILRGRIESAVQLTHMTESSPTDTPRSAGVEIKRFHDDHGIVLALRGELDLSSSAELERQLTEVTTQHPARVLIDLGDLEFMDSTGLALLIRARQAAEAGGYGFCLRAGKRQVHRLFEMTGLYDAFTFVGTAPGESRRPLG
jgi:anti-sigma B factor antagonist